MNKMSKKECIANYVSMVKLAPYVSSVVGRYFFFTSGHILICSCIMASFCTYNYTQSGRKTLCPIFLILMTEVLFLFKFRLHVSEQEEPQQITNLSVNQHLER